MLGTRGLATVAIAVASALAAPPVLAQGLPVAKAAAEVGLSSERLKRLSATVKSGVDKSEMPGAAVVIGRHGKIAYLESFGFRDREAKAPMMADAIFRIASMTKPIVSLAIMMLAEEGRLVSCKSIELMTMDRLPPGTKIGPDMTPAFQALLPAPEMGQGFGLGFAVRIDTGRNPRHGSVGDDDWGGAFGTDVWIDPKEKLFAILMMQAPAQRLPYRYLMRELVY